MAALKLPFLIKSFIMRLINSVELNDILSNNLEQLKYNYFDRAYSFELMFKTGCRVNETLELNRWNIINDNEISLQPQKGNLLRVFNKSIFENNFINAIENNLPISTNLTTDKLRYNLQQHFLDYGFIIGKKRSISHIFRHNYAKQLKLNGSTDLEIKSIMGEKKLSSAMAYIYSDVFVYF